MLSRLVITFLPRSKCLLISWLQSLSEVILEPPKIKSNYVSTSCLNGLPWQPSGKESACQCRRLGFHSWVRRIPWRRKWQPDPAFLPGKSHGRRSLVGYRPWGCKRVGHDLVTKQPQILPCTHQHRITQKSFTALKIPFSTFIPPFYLELPVITGLFMVSIIIFPRCCITGVIRYSIFRLASLRNLSFLYVVFLSFKIAFHFTADTIPLYGCTAVLILFHYFNFARSHIY